MKRQITKEQIQKAYYDKFSFQPEINNLSKKIARKRSLDSLAFDKDKCKKKKVLKEVKTKFFDLIHNSIIMKLES